MNPEVPDSDKSPAFVEDDFAKTQMEYGTQQSRLVYGFIVLAWTGLLIGVSAYLFLYYFPSLAEWRAW
jgi:hypothetical protein